MRHGSNTPCSVSFVSFAPKSLILRASILENETLSRFKETPNFVSHNVSGGTVLNAVFVSRLSHLSFLDTVKWHTEKTYPLSAICAIFFKNAAPRFHFPCYISILKKSLICLARQVDPAKSSVAAIFLRRVTFVAHYIPTLRKKPFVPRCFQIAKDDRDREGLILLY